MTNPELKTFEIGFEVTVVSNCGPMSIRATSEEEAWLIAEKIAKHATSHGEFPEDTQFNEHSFDIRDTEVFDVTATSETPGSLAKYYIQSAAPVDVKPGNPLIDRDYLYEVEAFSYSMAGAIGAAVSSELYCELYCVLFTYAGAQQAIKEGHYKGIKPLSAVISSD